MSSGFFFLICEHKQQILILFPNHKITTHLMTSHSIQLTTIIMNISLTAPRGILTHYSQQNMTLNL